MLSKHPNNLRPSSAYTTGSSNDLNTYVLQDVSREHRSDYDLTSLQQNQTKKSVSFSENIAKHLISPCNPAIKFDPAPEIITDDDDDDESPPNNELTMALHGNKEILARKPTARYGEMRRCQSKLCQYDYFKIKILIFKRILLLSIVFIIYIHLLTVHQMNFVYKKLIVLHLNKKMKMIKLLWKKLM
jgi:hypothetical protein